MIPLNDLTAALLTVNLWLGDSSPETAIVLGSGLSSITDCLEEKQSLPYAEIPGLAAAGVSGHSGFLHAGNLFGQPVLIFQGRYHCYEGYSAWQVTALVRLAAAVGCRKMVLTNAAGGIADDMQAGDFMLVTDHLNMVGESPLRGRAESEFIDLSGLYQCDFYPELKKILAAKGTNLHAGNLAWMLGPNYETPAEIKMLQILGASAVSMSTIPEAIIARRFGLELVAVSYISNLAAGKSTEVLDHRDVLNRGEHAALSLKNLFSSLFKLWNN